MVTDVDPAIIERWLSRLKRRDPELSAELEAKRTAHEAVPESFSTESVAPAAPEMILETLVQEGRPALLVMEGKITLENTLVDDLARSVVDRLMASAPTLDPLLPLIGRIDVANHASGQAYLGTGWLVDRGVVVTNRHVAELIARNGAADFAFQSGRFGETLRVSFDNRREYGREPGPADARKIERVIWIEPEGADIAFLGIEDRADGTAQTHIMLADVDAEPDLHVAVIGYPARASPRIIPDQAWMERVYGGLYDIKRAAPGQMDLPSRGWATHDCTTLGGASGSPVLDMASGRAVGLHFAGLYMVENYAVPASKIREYRDRRPPWRGGADARGAAERAGDAPVGQGAGPASPTLQSASGRSLSITIPLTISISAGEPSRAEASLSLDETVAAITREAHRGVLAVKPGHIFTADADAVPCVVVAARPDRVRELRAELPARRGAHPLDVRPATLDEQRGVIEDAQRETTASISYDDDARTGPAFSFAPIEGDARVICHVGPEASWPVLKDFLSGAERELVSSIYEFHAAHIAEAIEQELEEGASLTLVLDGMSRDGGHGAKPGDFARGETFARWASKFEFASVFVPEGADGLVANAYHIKVTVRDGDTVWLSSGNWKRTSQPLPPAAAGDARAVGASGNREWHVVVASEPLAERFRSHINADLEASRRLGGRLESATREILVDVPVELEAIELEAPPSELLEPLTVSGNIRVTPLLTPDRGGRVFTEAVLELIASARRQLVFQNQYIKIRRDMGGNLGELVDALVERAREIEDFRIILRSGDAEFLDAMSELKRRGLDVERVVRRMAATHTKGIVVDGRRVLIGSHNWSGSGVSLNRDASLIFDHEAIAGYFLRAFEIDWMRARPIVSNETERAVRIAEGAAPPPGYRRMTLAEFEEG